MSPPPSQLKLDVAYNAGTLRAHQAFLPNELWGGEWIVG